MQKKRLNEILTAGVIGVPPATAVAEAIRIMRTENISCIVILEDSQPIGIFTERNVVRFTAQQGADFDDSAIRELMSSPVLTAGEDTDIYTAFNLLETNDIRHLVVVNHENQVVGVVTQSNMIEHLGLEYFIEVKKVSQIMTKILSTISKDITVYQALTEMAGKSISCLIVAQNNRPLGILTERDVGRLLVDYVDISEVKVEAVMSSPVQTASPDTSVHEVAKIMQKQTIRRVVVIDKDGKIVGLITQSDIIKGLEAKYIEILKQLIREKDVVIEKTLRDLADKTVYLDNILRSSIDMGIVAMGLDFRIAYFNPGAEQILGYAAEEIIGRDAREIDFRKIVGLPKFDRIAETISENKSHTFTFEQDKNDAKWFIHARVSGIWDKERKLVGFVMMFRDITEHREAEAALRAAHEKYKTLVESSLTGIFIHQDGKYVFVNNRFAEIHGYEPDALMGMEHSILIHPDEREPLRQIEKRRLDGAPVSPQYEVRRLRKDGTTIWCKTMATCIEYGGRPAIMGNIIDISERKRALAAIRQRDETLSGIISSMTDHMSLIDKEHNIVWANSFSKQLFGPDLVGKKCYGVYQRYDKPCSPCLVKKCFKDGMVHEHEKEVIGDDGTRMIFWCTASVGARHSDGRPSLAVLVGRNITERKRAEEALRKRKEALRAQTHRLAEANTAMKVLLKRRLEDKIELEEKVLANVKELVLPYVEALKRTQLGAKQTAYTSIIESHLHDIISPFLRSLSSKYVGLTPREIQVAGLVKQGKTNKEMAELLGVSVRAVEFHRESIRAKLGLKHQPVNLRSFLLSLQ